MASNYSRVIEPWTGTGWPPGIFIDKNLRDEKKSYMCSRQGCERMLREPWSLSCGHRMCKACIDITRALPDDQRICYPCKIEKFDELARATGLRAPADVIGGVSKTSAMESHLTGHDNVGSDSVAMEVDASSIAHAQGVAHTSDSIPSAENYKIDIEKANKDTAANREVSRFAVKCPYECSFVKEKGLVIRTLEKHMTECMNRQIPCEKCTETIKYSAKEEHMRDICQFRPAECPNKCGKRGLQGRDLIKHLAECDKKPPMCEICKSPYPGVDLHTHLLDCRPNGPCPLKCEHPVGGRIMDHFNNPEIIYLHCMKIKELAEEARGAANNPNSAGVTQAQITGILDRLLQLENRTENTQRQLIKRVAFLTNEKASDLLENSRLAAQNRKDLKDLDGLFKVLAGDVHLLTSYDTTLRGLAEKAQKVERETSDRLSALETQSNIRVAEIEDQRTALRNFQMTSFNGHLIWTIDRVQSRRQEADTKHNIYSHPFYTDVFGYKMCARIYFNGDGSGQNTHISLFFVVMKGEFDALLPWPFQQKVTMKLKNQTKKRSDIVEMFRPEPSSSSFTRPKNEMNIASGCPQFAKQSIAFSPENGYLVDNTMFIEIVVDSSYETLHGLSVSVSEQGRGSAAGRFTDE